MVSREKRFAKEYNYKNHANTNFRGLASKFNIAILQRLGGVRIEDPIKRSPKPLRFITKRRTTR